MSVSRVGGIFVSYRREGSGDAAARLTYHLRDRFGMERVFMDVDAIEPGMDYVEAITRAVEACDVARRNALRVRHESFRDDAARLIAAIERALPPAAVETESPRSSGDPARAARLFRDAERLANAITDEYWKAAALRDVARIIAATNPDRAERLSRDAERAASAITDEREKGFRLRNVANAVTAIDPARAERIAGSITDERRKASALSSIVKALVST